MKTAEIEAVARAMDAAWVKNRIYGTDHPAFRQALAKAAVATLQELGWTPPGANPPDADLIDACDVACSYLEDIGEAQRAAAKELRDAVRASNPPEGWREPDELPEEWRDGRLLPAVVDGETRTVRYGKTSHVPLYGWCLADQGSEEFDLCRPTMIYALPQPPETK